MILYDGIILKVLATVFWLDGDAGPDDVGLLAELMLKTQPTTRSSRIGGLY